MQLVVGRTESREYIGDYSDVQTSKLSLPVLWEFPSSVGRQFFINSAPITDFFGLQGFTGGV